MSLGPFMTLFLVAIIWPLVVIFCAWSIWWCGRTARTRDVAPNVTCPDTQQPCDEFCEPHKGDTCARTGEAIK